MPRPPEPEQKQMENEGPFSDDLQTILTETIFKDNFTMQQVTFLLLFSCTFFWPQSNKKITASSFVGNWRRYPQYFETNAP